MRSSITKLFIALFVVSAAWACSPTRTATASSTAVEQEPERPSMVDDSAESEPSARSVLTAYVEALGGVEKLQSVNTLTTSLTGVIQGATIEQTFYQSGGTKFSSQTTMMGMTVADQRYNNGAAKVVQQGAEMTLDDDMIQGMAEQARLFPEVEALQDLSGYSLEGTETIDGEATYVVMRITDLGNQKDYFSQETGLKVRTVVNASGQTQTINVSDYRSVGGIMFPHQMQLTGVAPFPVSMETKEIKINEPIDESLFVID
ncbi:MAG: hypothetical protein AAF433_01635 [Bacteroidota bacterium]